MGVEMLVLKLDYSGKNILRGIVFHCGIEVTKACDVDRSEIIIGAVFDEAFDAVLIVKMHVRIYCGNSFEIHI